MGQDAALDRPSAVRSMGVEGAQKHLKDILSGAIASIPHCPGEADLAKLVLGTARRIMDIPTAAARGSDFAGFLATLAALRQPVGRVLC